MWIFCLLIVGGLTDFVVWKAVYVDALCVCMCACVCMCMCAGVCAYGCVHT